MTNRNFRKVVEDQQKAIREDMNTWPQWMRDAMRVASATFPKVGKDKEAKK